MSIYYAQNFHASFARAVQEAGAEQPRSLHAPPVLRSSRRLARRPRVPAASTTGMPKVVEMNNSSLPPPSPSPPKRLRLCPPLPLEAKSSATRLWRASAFDAIVECERKKILSFVKANTTTVCVSFPGFRLSVAVASDCATMRKVREIASRLCSLGVGAPTTTLATKKRSYERLLEDV